MRDVYDFSNALIRCHAIYYIVSKGKYPTPKEKYDQMELVLAEERVKYDNLSDNARNGKLGPSKAAKIAGLEFELAKLEPKRYDDPLPAGAKSYLKRLYGYLKYGKWSASKDKGNKYTEKGKLAEPDSIALINFLDDAKYVKNDVRVENEFLSGIPDIIDESNGVPRIIDVKSSWDWETFAENIGKPLNPLYWWQLQGYMDVKGFEVGEVSYCLVDTPESIINDEKIKLAKRMDALTIESPEYRLAEALLVNNLTFSDIPAIERRLKYPVERDQDAIDKIHSKVPKCRDYLFELQEMHLTGFFTDKELPILDTIEEI